MSSQSFIGSLTSLDIQPSSFSKRVLKELILLFAGSLFIALLAQISLPLPFSPVPITGQSLAILLVGCAYGKRAPWVVLTYLLEGGLGLPFFAGGSFGVSKLVGPTGGYLIGFWVASLFLGIMAEKGYDKTLLKSLVIFLTAKVIIFSFGLLWLVKFVGVNQVWAMGLWPFLPGLLLKVTLASVILPSVWKLKETFHK